MRWEMSILKDIYRSVFPVLSSSLWKQFYKRIILTGCSRFPEEKINVQEALQHNWKSLLALHIFLSFVACCVKVIFLRQEDVVVEQQCSKQKGWQQLLERRITCALRAPTTAGGYSKCRHCSSRLPSLLPFLFFLLEKIPYFKWPSGIWWRCFAPTFLPDGQGFQVGPTLPHPDSDPVYIPQKGRQEMPRCLGLREWGQFNVQVWQKLFEESFLLHLSPSLPRPCPKLQKNCQNLLSSCSYSGSKV